MIIIGSGPAGYTAALYTSRADLEPLVFEGFAWGGLLQQTTDVENYPGYPEGVMGPEMMQEFRDQAERFGTRFVTDDVTRVELSDDGGIHRVFVGDEEHLAKSVILAMGAEPKKLGVPGEDELASRGRLLLRHLRRRLLPRQAHDRGRRRRHRHGGRHLPRQVRQGREGHPPPRRVPRLGDHARPRPRRRTTSSCSRPTRSTASRRARTGRWSSVVLDNADGGEDRTIEIDGAFIAIGHEPELGHRRRARSRRTRTATWRSRAAPRAPTSPGVFAAGDLVDHTYRQAVTAAGSGCAAALDAEAYLRDTPPDPEAHWAGDPAKIEAAAQQAAS